MGWCCSVYGRHREAEQNFYSSSKYVHSTTATDFSLLLFGQECMSDKVSRRDTTNYQKLMNCIKIQLSVDAKKKYIKHLRSKSLNLSLNMMIHQIKASNYLMAPWITTVFLLDLIWKMALSYFFLMLFMKSPKEMNDDDLVGKKFLLACHSKNSIHFCCQRNSIKRRGSKQQNRTISISKVGKLSSLYSKNFFSHFVVVQL